MALDKMAWILLGLFLQYQLMAADKSVGVANLAAAVDDNKDATDDTEKVQHDQTDPVDARPSDYFDIDELSDMNDFQEDKRGYGKWRNMKWSQGGTKRNIGRWKNRKWRDMQSYGLLSGNGAGYGHSLRKRFTDNDFESNEKNIDDNTGYGVFNGDFIVPGTNGYIDYYGAGGDLEDIPDNYIDKRHMSRWNLIHRKLAELSPASKRESTTPSEEKRMGSRWRIIQNKLNQLQSGRSKRFAGRWKNQNWLLQQAYQADDAPAMHDLQKRFIGKRKNSKWLQNTYDGQ